ncbi:MAG: hypothetical protein JWN92_686 [Candidatus Acidoferrum typicum]|nr:hypothetical protein [Candidatus Acidoferrum typicum]
MTHVIDTVFIDAILGGVLRELGLPETLPLSKLSPRMQKWVLGEAACLQPEQPTERGTRTRRAADRLVLANEDCGVAEAQRAATKAQTTKLTAVRDLSLTHVPYLAVVGR